MAPTVGAVPQCDALSLLSTVSSATKTISYFLLFPAPHRHHCKWQGDPVLSGLRGVVRRLSIRTNLLSRQEGPFYALRGQWEEGSSASPCRLPRRDASFLKQTLFPFEAIYRYIPTCKAEQEITYMSLSDKKIFDLEKRILPSLFFSNSKQITKYVYIDLHGYLLIPTSQALYLNLLKHKNQILFSECQAPLTNPKWYIENKNEWAVEQENEWVDRYTTV